MGIGMAWGLADMADGADFLIGACTSALLRNPHFGQYLDLWGRTSLQCGHSIDPQFWHRDLPTGICEWQTEHRVILGITFSAFSDYFAYLLVRSISLLILINMLISSLHYYTLSQKLLKTFA